MSTTPATKTVIAVFRDYNEAEAVLHDLLQHGFQREDVSLIAADRSDGVSQAGDEATKAAGSAGTGAAVGGMAGLVLGLAALAIPGIGPVIAAGPLAAAIGGLGIGAAAGGIIGGLTQLGVPHEHAASYEELVRKGGTVIAVRATGDMVDRAEGLFERHGAEDINEQPGVTSASTDWRPHDPHARPQTQGDEGGVSDFGHTALAAVEAKEKAEPKRTRTYVSDPSNIAPIDTHVRRTWEECWADRMQWREFSDAYRFGYSLGASSRYGSTDWVDVEGDARRGWLERGSDAWEHIRDVVRMGWHSRRGGKLPNT